jgi:hypothetical protein
MVKNSDKIFWALLSFFCLGLGAAFGLGFWSMISAILLFSSLLAIGLCFVAENIVDSSAKYLNYLLGMFILTSILLGPEGKPVFTWWMGFYVLAFLIWILSFKVEFVKKNKVWIILGLIVVGQGGALLAYQNVFSDVVYEVNYGVDYLLKGIFPYTAIPITHLGDPWRYYYLPGGLFLSIPFRLILGDARWVFIVAEIITVFVLKKISKGSTGENQKTIEALILIPLVVPKVSLAYFWNGNIEWLLIVSVSCLAYFLIKKNKWATGIALGLGVGIKQQFIIYPALFLWNRYSKKTLLIAVMLAGLIVLPFAIWDYKTMSDALLYVNNKTPIPERVTLWSLFYHLGIILPKEVRTLMLFGAIAISGGVAYLGRHSYSKAFIGAGLGMTLASLLANFSAYNYFHYALFLVALGLIFSLLEKEKVI